MAVEEWATFALQVLAYLILWQLYKIISTVAFLLFE